MNDDGVPGWGIVRIKPASHDARVFINHRDIIMGNSEEGVYQQLTIGATSHPRHMSPTTSAGPAA